MSVIVFQHSDVTVKIYEETAGARGACLTSDWLYVADVKCVETANNRTSRKLYAGYSGFSTLNHTRILTITKAHTSDTYDFELAITYDQDYWIEIEFTDPFYNETKTYTCKHCRHDEREVSTRDEGNVMTRRWLVGEIS